jgi:hypothetical protein
MRYEAVFATGWSKPEVSSYDLILYRTVKVKVKFTLEKPRRPRGGAEVEV